MKSKVTLTDTMPPGKIPYGLADHLPPGADAYWWAIAHIRAAQVWGWLSGHPTALGEAQEAVEGRTQWPYESSMPLARVQAYATTQTTLCVELLGALGALSREDSKCAAVVGPLVAEHYHRRRRGVASHA